MAVKLLEVFGLREHFPFVISIDQFKTPKPSPESIDFALKFLEDDEIAIFYDDNVDLIQSVLKDRTLDFITEHQRQFAETQDYEQNSSKDVMKIVVKQEGKVIAYREWDATIYPVKVRYTVDIRQHIYDLITRVQKCLCTPTKELETTYLNYSLQV